MQKMSAYATPSQTLNSSSARRLLVGASLVITRARLRYDAIPNLQCPHCHDNSGTLAGRSRLNCHLRIREKVAAQRIMTISRIECVQRAHYLKLQAATSIQKFGTSSSTTHPIRHARPCGRRRQWPNGAHVHGAQWFLRYDLIASGQRRKDQSRRHGEKDSSAHCLCVEACCSGE